MTVRWKTRDGRVLAPEEMETSHLVAVLAMCDRRVKRHLYAIALSACHYAATAPDGAAMAAESASDECIEIMYDPKLLRKEGCRLSKVIAAMDAELKRRLA